MANGRNIQALIGIVLKVAPVYNIGREPLGSRRDIVIVVEEYFLKKGFTEHYISLNIVH